MNIEKIRKAVKKCFTKLKPCPFCGGKATVDMGIWGNYWCSCKVCGMEMEASETKDLAIQAWNRRVTFQEPPKAQTEELKPCPHCGSKYLSVVKTTETVYFPDDNALTPPTDTLEVYVKCNSCFCHGGYGPDEEIAIAEWNKRK